MKLTKTKLKQLIKEEIKNLLQEGPSKWCVKYKKERKEMFTTVIYTGAAYDEEKIKADVRSQVRRRLAPDQIISINKGNCPAR